MPRARTLGRNWTAAMDTRIDHRIVHRVNTTGESVYFRRADSRKGLYQILEMDELPSDSGSSSSSSARDAQTQVELSQDSRSSWCFPQLGAAVPSLNEVSLRLAETASLFSRQISGFVERDPARPSMVELSEVEPLTGEESTSDTVEPRTTVEISGEEMVVSASQNDSLLAIPNFGGAVSLFNATSAAMMGMGQSLITGPPAVWQGLVSRVQTTLRGSADDIGWLQKDPTLPPVVDKTERFLEILGRISHGVHVLPNTLVYLLIPGLFSNHGPLYFVEAKKYFSKMGLACHIARIHSEAAVEKNARELKDFIEELYWGTGKRVLLLGHSKGGVDAAAACSIYWSDLKDKVAGLVFAQSPYGGSPVASDILREGQIADSETRRVLEVIITKVIKGDMQSLEDLTYEKRRKFLALHPLPLELVTVSFHTEASRSASVLATMSHIAHADLPWLPGTSSATSDEQSAAGGKLPVVIPLSAAMALCALHLDLRYGEKSDGLVTRKDAEIPGSLVVRPEKKLDHAWMVYSPSRKEPNDPNSSQMCEALLTLLLEEEASRNAASSTGTTPVLENISTDSAPATSVEDVHMGEEYLEKL